MNSILRIIFYSDLNPVRLLLALAEFAWAISLFLPELTLNNTTYHSMWSIIPSDNIWGSVFLLTGILQIHFVITSRIHSKCAIVFAGYNSILWLFVAWSLFLGVSPPPSISASGFAMSFASAWVFLRTGWIPTGGRQLA